MRARGEFMGHYVFSSLGLLLVLAFTAACTSVTADLPPMPTETADVDPQFREYYNFLGGNDVLGPAISPVLKQGGKEFQYTENSLMVYDPQAPYEQQYFLENLGQEMEVAEPPLPAPEVPNSLYVGGHYLFADFASFYERLGGERVVGVPLTELKVSPQLKRYEQYFEKLGFYRMEGDPPGVIHLLAYGAWRCNVECRRDPPTNASVLACPSTNSPFDDFADQLGKDFTGFALTEDFKGRDGKLEQVFENVVLVQNPLVPDSFEFRPVPEQIGSLPDQLVPPSTDPQMYFYELEGGRGHNVPQYFVDYILSHGGFERIGAPINELAPDGRVYRQCFTYVCLAYNPANSAGYQVRPEPLGYNYKQIFYQPSSLALPSPSPSRQVVMQVWESYPVVSSNQEQEIGVSVTENDAPMVNVVPLLELTMPDGTNVEHTLPPTGGDGQSRVLLTPIEAANGTLIPYQVCLTNQVGGNYCFKDSYLIWNNP